LRLDADVSELTGAESGKCGEIVGVVSNFTTQQILPRMTDFPCAKDTNKQALSDIKEKL
jgi:hypothetical protein